MTRPVSHLAIIRAIVLKDLKEYGRDKLWAFLTVMVLVVVIVLFWVMPDDVDESLTFGLAGVGELTEEFSESLEAENDQGVVIVAFETADDLRAVIEGDASAWQTNGVTTVVPDGEDAPDGAERTDVSVGIAFPESFLAAPGEEPVTVYVEGSVPEGIERAVSGIVNEIGYALAGEQLPVETASAEEVYVVLGEDRVGNQVTPRESFRPLLVFLVLLMEMFVMSSVIAKEIQDKTVTALLVTPATTSDVLAAKGLAGSISGIAQATVLLIALQSLGNAPVLVLTLMLLGAIMVAGTAMIAGSAGKDFMGTLFYGMAFMIPLMIPAFSALFPGTASAWIRALPSYPLIDGLVEVITYDQGWADVLPQLGLLLAWCVGLFAIGWVVLKRRVETI